MISVSSPQITPAPRTERERSRVSLLSRVPYSLLLLLSVGCGSEIPELEQTVAVEGPIAGASYAPANAGRVTGLVTWNGRIPNPPGFLYGVPRADGLGFEFRTAKNPNRPQINPKSRAVANAVVFLRGIDAAIGKPWDLPAASVEVADAQIV